MAAGGIQKTYGPEDLVKVMRSVSKYFDSHSKAELLKTQGLLRVSGTKEALDRIYLGLIQNKTLESMGPDITNVHNVIGAAKQCFIQAGNWLFNSSDPTLISFREKINAAGTEELKAGVLREFIDELATSGDHQKLNAAEIMYSYIHLATLISEHEKINKMTPSNSAIVIGAGFQNILSIVQVDTTDPMAAMARANEVNDIFTEAISSKEYTKPFREQYRTQYRAAKTKEKADTESNLESMLGLTQRLQNRIAQDAKELEKLEQLVVTTKKKMGKSKAQPAIQAKESKSKHLNGLITALQDTTRQTEELGGRLASLRDSIDSLATPLRSASPDRNRENRPPALRQPLTPLRGSGSPLREAPPSFSEIEEYEKAAFIDELLKFTSLEKPETLTVLLSQQTADDIKNIHTKLTNEFPITSAREMLEERLYTEYQSKSKAGTPRRRGPSSSSSSGAGS